MTKAHTDTKAICVATHVSCILHCSPLMTTAVRCGSLLRVAIPLFFALLCMVRAAQAQVEPPDRKFLYLEDKYKKETTRVKKAQIKSKRKSADQQKSSGQFPFDINATNINFDSTGNVINASGNVIITYSTLVAEAMQGKVDTTSNEAELKGDVRISDLGSNITSDSAYINLKDGSGMMQNVDIFFEEGDYHISAEKAERSEGEKYTLYDTELTTCNCPAGEGCYPWSLKAKEASVTRNGYGQAWNTTLNVCDVPVLYTPYLIFPAKNERQSGFLAPAIGSGNRSGFAFQEPFFWAIDRSTDATITAVVETNSRIGTDIQFRKLFSSSHQNETGFIYLDESLRDGDLQGTNVDGLDDKTFDENRFGGYIDHSWRGRVGPVPLQLLIDGNYVSDDLFLREYEKDKIAKYNTRFVTSNAVLRAPVGDTFSLDISSEYNQAMVEDNNFPGLDADDIVFQRLPEASLYGINTLRPFGENPLGLRLVFNHTLTGVNFSRREGYEGQRGELYERVKLPFYFKNFFDGSVEGSVRATKYHLGDDRVPEAPIDEAMSTTMDDEDSPGSGTGGNSDLEGESFTRLKTSSDRVVPGLTSKMGTVVERVYEVPEDNLLKTIPEFGRLGRRESLVRIKHTLEPSIKHQLVSDIDQSENPQFDSDDRLAERNVVTYQLVQRLFGRFEPRNEYLYGIEETTPEIDDLGNLRTNDAIDRAGTFGFTPEVGEGYYQPLRRGSVVEMMNFKLAQSFDVVEDRQDNDPNRDALSDVAAELNLYPNEYVRLRTRADYDEGESRFSAYTIEGQFSDKRGDSLRTRLRFIEDSVRQLESSAEFRLTQQIKLGYYSRYDDLEGEFIEQKAGVRFASSCNCWVMDLDVADKTNPDETRFGVTVTLVGLGEAGNTFLTRPGNDTR